jgi:hypothetical protein
MSIFEPKMRIRNIDYRVLTFGMYRMDISDSYPAAIRRRDNFSLQSISQSSLLSCVPGAEAEALPSSQSAVSCQLCCHVENTL